MSVPAALPTPTPQSSVSTPAPLPRVTVITMFVRLLAIQGSWNYEILLGNGIGFCVEPALRLLPGGQGGEAYRQALARQSQYFNAHPYLAAVAVGALARAELDGEPPVRIERFRTALCGPLGSVGDRLVWAGWVPFCSFLTLAAVGLGLGPMGTVLFFLAIYNAGHLWLRVWGLREGLRRGLRVAQALGHPVLRQGPVQVARATAIAAGVALPLVLSRIIGSGRAHTVEVLAAVAIGAVILARLHGRVEGWRIALGVLAAFVLYSVALHG
jgi:PTS system mannose-specific IID component